MSSKSRKSDNIPIKNENLDKRVKLSETQKEEIRQSSTSSYKLAALYGVSRRTIQFIKDPKKLEENKARRQERGGSAIYYDKAKHTAAMKRHRDYKKQLYDNGLISITNTEGKTFTIYPADTTPVRR